MKYTRIVGISVFLCSLSFPLFGYAQSFNSEALKQIQIFATNFCGAYYREGSSQKLELDGKAEAKLNGLLKKLTDMGISGAAKFSSMKYIGLHQGDLAPEYKNIRACKLQIWNDLKNTILMTPPSKKNPKASAPKIEGLFCLSPEDDNSTCAQVGNIKLVSFLENNSGKDINLDIDLEWFGFADPCEDFRKWDNKINNFYFPLDKKCTQGFRVYLLRSGALESASGNDYRKFKLRGKYFVGSVGSAGTPEYELTAQ